MCNKGSAGESEDLRSAGSGAGRDGDGRGRHIGSADSPRSLGLPRSGVLHPVDILGKQPSCLGARKTRLERNLQIHSHSRASIRYAACQDLALVILHKHAARQRDICPRRPRVVDQPNISCQTVVFGKAG